jgi:DNA modification methylase
MTNVLDQCAGERYQIYNGDSIEVCRELTPDSIGLSVFSPPFPGMYAYTNSARDVGNVKSFAQLVEHFGYLAGSLLKATQPGRICAIHLTQEPVFKGRDGYVGLRDFRGDMIRAMQDIGWIYYSEVTIDKNPMLKASRTKEATLLFKTLAADSSMNRPALADYLVVFKKPGENSNPIKAGISERYDNRDGWITSDEWCEWASPVWYRAMPKEKSPHYPYQENYPSRHQATAGINEGDVLRNFVEGRDNEDEKHLCPLQLGVIERAVKLWSNPDDVVLSPFMGIGSEGYVAVRHNRRFIGCELKPSYFRVAARNLRDAEARRLNADEDLFTATAKAEGAE